MNDITTENIQKYLRGTHGFRPKKVELKFCISGIRKQVGKVAECLRHMCGLWKIAPKSLFTFAATLQNQPQQTK